MRRVRVTHLTAAVLTATLLSHRVPADETSSGSVGIFQLGLRAVYLDPHNPVAPPPPEIDMSGKVYPEIFGEWFLARGWSTELSIGAPTNFSVTNDAGIGIRLTPIILTAKYHLLPGSRVQPYLGAGLHYTQTSLVHVPQSTYPKFPSSTTGFVAQVGVDLRTASSWYVDADIRYVSGLEPGGYKIDPFLYSLGVSYRW